ncbi:MAG: DUF5615 family PIN-like protein [Acidobacteria bacterium]|nr:DUF5615 family PIN-like protein [Acidobacteriota bacterium]MCI0720117.1 DUF5615 family PIN-like protein [Acidobacteriota bacterium]
MKLLLDQGLPRGSAELLRSRGIDTVHVGELAMASADDPSILDTAREVGRVVVTLDADFHTLLALSGCSSPSVIRIRIEKLRAAELAELLFNVTTQTQQPLIAGAMVSVQPTRLRVRHLPLGRAETPRD